MRIPAAMRLHFTLTAAALTVAAVAACNPTTTPVGGLPPASTQAAPACLQQIVTVTTSPTDPATYDLSGWLCRPADTRRVPTTVQLLVSGLTFDHTYWDVGYQPDRYSYVRAAVAAGYATFNIDRLGVGTSGRPPADKLTLQTHAYTVTQLVAQLHAGTIGGTAFKTVVGVGHSMGAAILQYQAGTATDQASTPDLLVLSDFLYAADPKVVAAIGAALQPAKADPRFASASLPDGYLTTRPGTRADLFLNTAPAALDQQLVGVDEQSKATTALAERTTLGAARAIPVLQAIRVPVLLTVGGRDVLDCTTDPGLSCTTPAAVLDREHNHFAAAACLAAYVLPDAGHATNLHRNAPDLYAYIAAWIGANVAGTGRDATGCVPAPVVAV